MDRDDHVRAEQGKCLGRAPGIEVALSDSRSPAPDREEGEVRTSGNLGEILEEVGVTREVSRALALDHESDGLPLPVERGTAPPVDSRCRPDRHPVQVNRPTRCQIDHAPETLPAKQAPGTGPPDYDRLPVQAAEARPVEMVEVMVRKEHRIDIPWLLEPPDPLMPMEVEHTVAEYRIGEEPRI